MGICPWANADKTLVGNVNYDYITFEPNKWRVASGEIRYIVPETPAEYRQTCFVSEAMSDNKAAVQQSSEAVCELFAACEQLSVLHPF